MKHANVFPWSLLHGGVESVFPMDDFATVLGKRRINSSKSNGIDQVAEFLDT
jgi:hypothetical protein